MDSVVKRVIVIIIAFLSFLLTSCEREMQSHHKKIQSVAEEAMEHFVNKDMDSLIALFSTDIQENRREETIEEIEALYDYLDGEIVSYRYDGEGGGQVWKKDGKIHYYNCYPSFEITTDNEKKYIVEYYYYYIWDEKSEQVGISKIYIYDPMDYSNGVGAGIVYYRSE